MNGNKTKHYERVIKRYIPNGRLRKKHNLLIRDTAKECGAYGYEVAQILGMSVETYTRMMRHELPMNDQEIIAFKIRETFGKEVNNE